MVTPAVAGQSREPLTAIPAQRPIYDGCNKIFRIGKVPCEFSRDQLIQCLSHFERLMYLHLTTRARSEYYECYFNFCHMADALKFLAQ